MIYFAFIDPHEVYDKRKHQREDLSILKMTLTEKEGGYPKASLLVIAQDTKFLKKPAVYISDKAGILFKGLVVKAPLQIKDQLMEIKLVGAPINPQDQLHKLVSILKKEGNWDPLFLNDPKQEHPYEILDANSKSVYWSRTDNKASLSDLFKGSKATELGEEIFKKGFELSLTNNPLSSVTVNLSAQWIQELTGSEDLAPLIREKCPSGLISTLTGPAFQKSWEGCNFVGGASGYTLARKALKEVFPPNTGRLDLYPQISKPLWIKGRSEGDAPQVLKRSWFRVDTLRVNWRYRQKREEIVTFTLPQILQGTGSPPKSRTLHIRLGAIGTPHSLPPWHPNHRYSSGFRVQHKGKAYICQKSHLTKKNFMRRYWKELDQNETSVLSQPSFFTTDRGKQAIYHALEIAKCHLAYSARAMTLSFKAPFEVVRKLTCDHQVTIKSKRLPNGQATGKVKSLTLMADGSTGSAWGEVQLACSIGKEEKNQKEAPYVNPYVAKEYCTHDYILNHQNRHQTPSSIHLKEFQHHLPTQGILHKLSRDELVQDINLENDATSQNNALSQYELISPIQLAEVLNQNPTTLKIALKNLRTTGTLAHTINLKITKGYTPPLQINLS